MTLDEIALMRQVWRYARHQGWYLAPYRAYRLRADRLMLVDLDLDATEAGDVYSLRVGTRTTPDGWWQYTDWQHPDTVRAAVDWLVGQGVLPAPFSSAYRLGWHAGRRQAALDIVEVSSDDMTLAFTAAVLMSMTVTE